MKPIIIVEIIFFFTFTSLSLYELINWSNTNDTGFKLVNSKWGSALSRNYSERVISQTQRFFFIEWAEPVRISRKYAFVSRILQFCSITMIEFLFIFLNEVIKKMTWPIRFYFVFLKLEYFAIYYMSFATIGTYQFNIPLYSQFIYILYVSICSFLAINAKLDGKSCKSSVLLFVMVLPALVSVSRAFCILYEGARENDVSLLIELILISVNFIIGLFMEIN
jgi:hypothetical protein